ncbi:molybdenum ABC transporter ATP-binding protein [Pollutimonas subterranea]|uniref:Molybdenum ABC transporter ATP-binding protein n=1 Tax=Pollutimonas subterranea TaxID=2045210 RepID=A0A2N4U6W6_9BURK|nr:molybdenum ABC transporter ATP-binding protein [Pollutimonas subterranea]PLC50762.1 molybdenum ABC transporter ATP-binding protein [Pollutimonas subterranea]
MSAHSNHIALQVSRIGFTLSVDISFPDQGITMLSGPSGSGKTTVLRCVAGLERAGHGVVRIAGETWQDSDGAIFKPTWQRPLGYVFQEASLFEHLNVKENLEYGLKRIKNPDARKSLEDSIDLLGIRALMTRRPEVLSGGERQRVAIARALATQPRLLLLDEPLSALDVARRQEVLPWLERIRDELGTPMLYVTHSADEIVRLADHLVLMDHGKVSMAGETAAVLASANSPITMGDDVSVLLNARITERDERWNLLCVTFDGGRLWAGDNGLPLNTSVRVRVLARDVSLTTDEPQRSSIQNHLHGIVECVVQDSHPSQNIVRIKCGNAIILARVTRKAVDGLGVQSGAPIWVQVKAVAVVA